jgi:hypothetical protein
VEPSQAAIIFALVVLAAGAVVFSVVFGMEPLRNAWAASEARLAERRAQVAILEEQRRRERELGVEVPLPPAVVLNRVVEGMLKAGHSVENRTANCASFVREEGADSCLGCVLMLLFLLPGLLYLLLARTTKRASVVAYPHEVDGAPGTRLVIGGDDQGTIDGLAMWVRNLAAEPTEAIEIEAPSEGSTADRLRELEGLKESGLISEDEYRAKRSQILEEM